MFGARKKKGKFNYKSIFVRKRIKWKSGQKKKNQSLLEIAEKNSE